jgi:hypothetical protein
MKWGQFRQFLKTQFYIGIANTIPFVGIAILELLTEDRIIQGSYDSFHKSDWYPAKWVRVVYGSKRLFFLKIYECYRPSLSFEASH